MPEESLLRLFRQRPTGPAAGWLAGVDIEYALNVARRVAGFGTYARGFRPAGSEAVGLCAQYLEAEMRRIGLPQVAVHQFGLDGWEFAGARVEPEGGALVEAVAYGGATGTPPEGLEGELVDCGHGLRRDYARVDVRGRIALVELDLDLINWPGTALLEAAQQGALAVVCWPGGHYAMTPGAMHCHDLQVACPVPMLNVSREAGRGLRQFRRARLWSTARPLPDATGRNIVGYLPGTELPHELVIIGDHYDAWFTGFMDDAVGVGAVLALAQAAVQTGYRPRRTLAFVLHDAEEYGQADSPWDWCTGAHQQITQLTPDWAGRTAGAVIFELCGFKDAPTFDWFVSPELAPLAEAVQEQLETRGRYPLGRRLYRLVSPWEDAFSYTAAGIPSAANLELPEYVQTRYYHTQFDTEALLDPEKYGLHVAGLGLLAARLAEEPVAICDLAARARDLRNALPNGAPGRLFDLVAELERAGERLAMQRPALGPEVNGALLAAAGVLSRGLTWLGGEGQDESMYPHEQPLADLAALKAGDPGGVAGMSWGRYVSYPVYRRMLFRQVDEPGRDWQWATGRLCPYLDLWESVSDERPVPKAVLRQARENLEQAYEHEIAVLEEALGLLGRISLL